MPVYSVGVSRRFTAIFYQNESPYDPPKVRYKRRAPDGTITTYLYLTDAALVRAETGRYYVDEKVPLNNDYAGEWLLRFEALESDLTTPQCVVEYHFTVQPSQFYT